VKLAVTVDLIKVGVARVVYQVNQLLVEVLLACYFGLSLRVSNDIISTMKTIALGNLSLF